MKKILFLTVTIVLCLAVTACGGGESGSSDGAGESSAEMITIGDISFQQPEGYPMEIEEGNLGASYAGDEDWMTGLGVYADTEEMAAGYGELYDSNPQTAEELYQCFINENPDIASKEKMEIDGTEAYAVTYDMGSGDETDIIFLYKNCVYSIVVWSEDGPIDEGLQAAFDTIVDTVTLN